MAMIFVFTTKSGTWNSKAVICKWFTVCYRPSLSLATITWLSANSKVSRLKFMLICTLMWFPSLQLVSKPWVRWVKLNTHFLKQFVQCPVLKRFSLLMLL